MKARGINMILTLLFASLMTATAQEHKIPFQNTTEGKLILVDFPGDLPITGYSGSEVIITALEGEFEVPERAKGLKAVYPVGDDNTGIGLSVVKEGNMLTVTYLLPMTRYARYELKVPENLSVEIESGCERGTNVSVSKVNGEVEVKTCNDIKITEVKGPLVLSSISGNIEIIFTGSFPVKPVSINSISGEVDITLPARTAANLDVKTFGGSFYSDFDFTQTNDNLKRIGGSNLNYSLNGGDLKISIATVNGNVYIRKGK